MLLRRSFLLPLNPFISIKPNDAISPRQRHRIKRKHFHFHYHLTTAKYRNKNKRTICLSLNKVTWSSPLTILVPIPFIVHPLFPFFSFLLFFLRLSFSLSFSVCLSFSLIQIKKSIKDIRGNVAEQLWKITKEVEVLIRENWTDKALRELKVPGHLIHIRWPEIELEFPPPSLSRYFSS